ncbi:cupin domain-containing protein [Nocardioides sp. B-3]|uniref:cupin domain-containing protein n=1 Tax=Nocardioides sp. B-3 TaxID=2895565 RepID=UPI002152DDF2|nr:cupin domain-containing protein [Nocardioides sp. B-3]UUZ58660.1 cupin domain-containing protein [Nocardioides sp. B-3]
MRNTDETERRWFYGGGVHDWLVTAADSGGSFLLFEDSMERGKRTPLHTHPVDETMYVPDGELTMHLDGVEHVVSAGGVVIAPRGVPHAFLVTSETARVLWLHTPGSCEAFYREASEPLSDTTPRVVDFDRIRAAALTAGGIDIIGPPPFAD